MNKKKQNINKQDISAVQWLADKVDNLIPFISDNISKKFCGFVEEAKEMEREQKEVTEDTSDGYHTFKELYEFRKVYNAALFNEWAKEGKYNVHKSLKHHDGELCFGGGWFIVVAILPTGQISNHYEIKDWDFFKCFQTEKAMFEFDGHTPKDVLDRINGLYSHLYLQNEIQHNCIDPLFEIKGCDMPKGSCANCGKEKFLHKKL